MKKYRKYKIDQFEITGIEKTKNTDGVNTVIVTFETKEPCSIKLSIPLLNTNICFIASLYRSIGVKKRGKKCRMCWDKLIGLTGKCFIGYSYQNGELEMADFRCFVD